MIKNWYTNECGCSTELTWRIEMGNVTHIEIVDINYCEMHRDAPKWARKLYADNMHLNHALTNNLYNTSKLISAYKQLEADNARLRELIKSVEYYKHAWVITDATCPWCGCLGGVDSNGELVHTHDDCPAFNPDGSVK